MNKKKVLFFSFSRSEFLRQINIIIETSKYFQTQTLIGGSHLYKKYGYTWKDINFYNIKFKKLKKTNLNFNNFENMSLNVLKLSRQIQPFIKDFNPNIIVLFGDRYELFAPAILAFGRKIIVLHIHGGSVTSGSQDDIVRHSITKMSHLHFTSTNIYVDRIKQLGEESWRIKNVGAPGLDYLKNNKLIKKDILFSKLNIPIEKKIVFFCMHPLSFSNKNKFNFIKPMLQYLNEKNFYIILTYPNSDPENNKIVNQIKKIHRSIKNSTILKNAGDKLFNSVIKHSSLIIGNSSLGIVESSYYKIPTLNIGDRQNGKVISKNILNSKMNFFDIKKKLKILISKSFLKRIKSYKSPYYKKNSSKLIAKYLKNITKKNNEKILMKKFVDMKT